MLKYLSILIAFFFVYNSTAVAQQIGTDFKVYKSSNKNEIQLNDIVADVNTGEVLIFGELHDDSIGHLLEKKIYELLHQKHKAQTILTLEMFERDVQHILNEYLNGIISEKNFIKEARAWNNYKDYKPLIEFAKENKLKVVAANSPARHTNLVTRKGLTELNTLDKTTKKNWIAPLPVDTLTGGYHERFMEIMGGHSAPGMNLYQSQNFWDATMSYSIHKALKQNKNSIAFHLNGKFHSDFYGGVAERLIKDYKRKVKTIACLYQEDVNAPDWEQLKGMADYIILTKKKEKPIE